MKLWFMEALFPKPRKCFGVQVVDIGLLPFRPLLSLGIDYNVSLHRIEVEEKIVADRHQCCANGTLEKRVSWMGRCI